MLLFQVQTSIFKQHKNLSRINIQIFSIEKKIILQKIMISLNSHVAYFLNYRRYTAVLEETAGTPAVYRRFYWVPRYTGGFIKYRGVTAVFLGTAVYRRSEHYQNTNLFIYIDDYFCFFNLDNSQHNNEE